MGKALFLEMGALSAQTMAAMTLIFWISLAVLGLGVLAAWRLYLPWFTWNRASGKGLDPVDCSLMIVGRNDPEGFERWIQSAFSQLPGAEILAVDNQSEDETANVLEALRRQYPTLIVVTLPASERFWSTRKLALTLAVKAAHHECRNQAMQQHRPDKGQRIRLQRRHTRLSLDIRRVGNQSDTAGTSLLQHSHYSHDVAVGQCRVGFDIDRHIGPRAQHFACLFAKGKNCHPSTVFFLLRATGKTNV